jgi:hypothetical protein
MYRDLPSSISEHDAERPADTGAATPDASRDAAEERSDAPVSTDDAADAASDAPEPADVVDGPLSDADFEVKTEAAAPNCPVKTTDVTAVFGERIAGRVVAIGSVNPYTKLMTERIGARTTRDHFVMFERVAGSWSKTDVSEASAQNPRTGGDICILSTAADVGSFGESNNGKDVLIQSWTAVSPAAELLLYLQFNGDPWADCLSVSHNARQLVRSAPETLTDTGMAVIGPDHDALVFRWGGFPWNGGDDWQVRARLGAGFVGGFTAWKYDGMHSFAGIHDDGTITIFRSSVLDLWKEDAVAPAAPRIVDVPIGWTSTRGENLAATSEDQHLFQFTHRTGEPWLLTDVTSADGEKAVGRPTRYELPSGFDTEEVLIARNPAGHLVYHLRDRDQKWHAFDLSRASRIDAPILGDPSAWATPVQAVAAQAADGRLLVFEGLECFRGAQLRAR